MRCLHELFRRYGDESTNVTYELLLIMYTYVPMLINSEDVDVLKFVKV